MRIKMIFIAILIVLFSACSTQTTLVATQTPELIIAPTPTIQPTPTPEPIKYVTLGSPFASDCGDGISIIRANAAFNGIDKSQCIDPDHGHSDIWVPKGCNIDTYNGEVIAPIEGNLVKNPGGYTLQLPQKLFPLGIEHTLEFAGIKNPDINKINSIRLELGHIEPIRMGYFKQGEPMGNIIPINPSGHRIQTLLAYWIGVDYQGEGYAISPSLFLENENEWKCVSGITLIGQCSPVSNNYPKNCK